MKKLVSSLMIGCLGGAMALGAYKLMEEPPVPVVVETAETNQPNHVKFVSLPNSPEATIDFSYAAEMSVNTVVHVRNEFTATSYDYDPFREFFYGDGRTERQQKGMSSGSGVIVSEDGYIVTNNHVINGADKVEVTLNSNKRYIATIIGTDPATDLALLKIDEQGLPFVAYGNSDQVRIGEWVLAVGNPFNLNSTVTAGIVSAKARNINLLMPENGENFVPLESFIQTDAAVNPGNSGGALVNSSGELIGINTAIASNTGSYSGYSFAVPVNIVKKVIKDLMEYGKVQRAFIGISIRNLDQSLADQIGVNDLEGVYVNGLMEDGAAASAGIEEGDVIRKIGNVSVKNVPELQEQVGKFRPGDKITVVAERDGKERLFAVVLRNKEGNTTLTPKNATSSFEAFGAAFIEPSSTEMKTLKIDSGVKVEKIEGGKLRSAGIKEGFIITKLNHEKIETPQELIKLLKSKRGGILIEGVHPNGKKGYYGFGL